MLLSGSQSELKSMQFAAEVDGSMQIWYIITVGNGQSSFYVKKYAKRAVL